MAVDNTIDDTVIDNNINKLITEISTANNIVKTLTAIKNTFISIQIYDKRVSNETGGYDITKTIPNPNNLSEEDNEKIRLILYNDGVDKFDALNLD